VVYLIAAILCWLPAMAQAGPVIGVLVTAVAGWMGGGVIATAIAQLAVSALLYAAASTLARQNARQRPQDLLRELQVPTSLPVYRFVYGRALAAGTPAPLRVKGDLIYACYILNSRPSEGPFQLFLDKRLIPVSGDPYDFAGVGAYTTTDPWVSGSGWPWVRYWIGRGDQVGPPDWILSAAGDLFSADDGWRGRTVLWIIINCGDQDNRAARWPSAPPEVLVDGYWSQVWDPRDPAQDPDDPATWQWSANQALCALDALRQNPLKPYDQRNLWLETWTWAADVADEPVTNKDATVSPRYEAHGTVAFSDGAELEDQLVPLMDAGAARFVRAGGQLGIVPGCPQDAAVVLTDMLDDQPPQLVRYADRDSLASMAVAKYPARDRAFEMTEAPAFVLSGAAAEDGGLESVIQPEYALVPDHRQVQRLQKIAVMRTRMQRQVAAVFPPVAFEAVAGSWVDLDLPAPYARWSRLYEVESTEPATKIDADDGVSLRCQMVLREASPDIYAWDAATEEQDVEPFSFNPVVAIPAPPGIVTLTTGEDVAVDAGVGLAAVRYAFDPSPSAAALQYEAQVRVDGGPWSAAGRLAADIDDGTGQVFGYIVPATVGADYEVRVRTLSTLLQSGWVVSSPITASLGVERYMADFDAAVYRLERVPVAWGSTLAWARSTTATYVDAAGLVQTAAAHEPRIDHLAGVAALLIEPAATNLVLYSADPANGWWSTLAASVASNVATSPAGTTTAARLTDAAASGQHGIHRTAPLSWASGTLYTSSIFAKADTLSQIGVQLGSGGTSFPTSSAWRAVFDLSGGTILSAGANITAEIRDIGSGWYRCSVSGTAAAASTETHRMALLAQAGNVSFAGSGTGSVLIWGAQLEAGALSSYVETVAAAASRAADDPGMAGLTAVLDLIVQDGAGGSTVLSDQAVSAGFWPAVSAGRIKKIIGTSP
jgi:hypothetical protein